MTDAYADLVARFKDVDDDILEAELGNRLKAAALTPGAGVEVNFAFTVEHLSLSGDAAELGNRLYNRISREMHEMLCGANGDDRDKIKKLIGLGDGVVAALTALMVSGFGLMPAIAAIIAALIARRFLTPAGDVLCEFWQSKLSRVAG